MVNIIKIHGGLGNQMFQFAFGRYLENNYTQRVVYDILEYDNNGGLRSFELGHIDFFIVASKKKIWYYHIFKSFWLNKLIFRKILKSSKFQTEASFHKSVICKDKDYYFWGYWQYPTLYPEIREKLIADFYGKLLLSKRARKFKDKIAKVNSVGIHVRKTDFLLQKNSFLAECGLSYYENAISLILKKSKGLGLRFFIFSDDFNWVENNLSILQTIEYEFVQGLKRPIEDQYLMSLCRYIVIANSTFSWWAAFLSDVSKGHVICPQNWFTNSNKTLNIDGWMALPNQ